MPMLYTSSTIKVNIYRKRPNANKLNRIGERKWKKCALLRDTIKQSISESLHVPHNELRSDLSKIQVPIEGVNSKVDVISTKFDNVQSEVHKRGVKFGQFQSMVDAVKNQSMNFDVRVTEVESEA